jgi:hypothetical protein
MQTVRKRTSDLFEKSKIRGYADSLGISIRSQDQMTHGYTAWHAIARLLDDIALIFRALRTDRDAPPRHDTSESAPMPDFRAGSDFRAWASEREVGEKHTADALCPAANDNRSAACRTMLPIDVVCSLRCDIDLTFAETRPVSS